MINLIFLRRTGKTLMSFLDQGKLASVTSSSEVAIWNLDTCRLASLIQARGNENVKIRLSYQHMDKKNYLTICFLSFVYSLSFFKKTFGWHINIIVVTFLISATLICFMCCRWIDWSYYTCELALCTSVSKAVLMDPRSGRTTVKFQLTHSPTQVGHRECLLVLHSYLYFSKVGCLINCNFPIFSSLQDQSSLLSSDDFLYFSTYH